MRALLAVAIVVLVGGCKKPTAPSVDAGAPVAEKPAELVAPALSTLSLLEPKGDRCEWRQLDPVGGHQVVLASFPGSCVGARVSWSPDASKAILWFDPRRVQTAGYASQVSSKPGYPDETVDEQATPRAFVVPTRRPQVEPLPLPQLGALTLQELGLDATGAVFALLEEAISEEDTQKGKVRSGEQTFDLTTITEGLPVLVHAYRREGATWKRTETKLSTTGWDYGLGVRELETFGKLGPRSVELTTAHAQGDSVEGDEAKALMALLPKGVTTDDGEWIFLGVGGARVNVWEVTGEFAYTTGLVALKGKPLPQLGFTDGDLVALRTSGPFLLVSGADVGTHPRLYELPSGKLVFSSDTARATTFWPTTARPESHEAH
ncbi:MAG: hypothetical protein ACOZQL_11125 [Myxococcota bacterium]